MFDNQYHLFPEMALVWSGPIGLWLHVCFTFLLLFLLVLFLYR